MGIGNKILNKKIKMGNEEWEIEKRKFIILKLKKWCLVVNII